MSLFDVIKYPVGRPATQEQLDALPTDLFERWKKCVNWGTASTRMISNSYINFYVSNDYDHYDFVILRKMIEDYDEPV